MTEKERPEFDFMQDILIDLDNLHEEWARHAAIRKKYADEVSYLEKVKSKAHEKVKVTRSRLIKEAKENKELKLTTADLRESYYRTHPDHIKAKEDQIDAEYNLGMCWNALRAMDDRKYALQDEVKLWINNYFAAPREERITEGGKIQLLKQIENQIEGERTKDQREKLNTTRRRRNKI